MKLERVTHESGEGGFWILPFLAVSYKQKAFVLWVGWLYWMWGLWFNGATPPSGRYGTKPEQQPTNAAQNAQSSTSGDPAAAGA